MKKEKAYQLTKYPLGSIREIFTISWPLILGLLSGSIMLFADRALLAKFSLDSMNAAATSGMAFHAFLILPITISGISEVFVGQYHGHRDSSKMGISTWQMIWFSIFLMPLFILIAYFAPKFLFSNVSIKNLESDYFFIMCNFGSIYCLAPALMGFFAGQGRVKLITIAAIFANSINIFLDILLIYGYKFIPSLGIKGAAIATVISQCFLVLFFLYFFLTKKSRKRLGTNKWKLHKEIFKKCVSIGTPAGIAHTSELLAHFVFFQIMMTAGIEYITISVLIQSTYLLFTFVIEGLSKGVTAVSSNFIGAHKYTLVVKNVKSSLKLHICFFSVIFIIFLFFSNDLFSYFFSISNVELFQNAKFINNLYISSIYLVLFFLLDGWGWALIGMLTAAGDTKFIMIVGLLVPWIIDVIPMYLGIKFLNITINQVWLWIIVYGFFVFIIYLWRYKSMRWKKIKLCDKKII